MCKWQLKISKAVTSKEKKNQEKNEYFQLLHALVLAVASQCLHYIKDSSASHPTPPARRLGWHKKMRGDRVRTADPNDHMAIPPMRPHAQHINQGESWLGAAAQEPSGHCGWWAIAWCVTCFVYANSFTIVIFPSFSILIKYLNPWISLFLPPILLPISLRGWGKWVRGCKLFSYLPG